MAGTYTVCPGCLNVSLLDGECEVCGYSDWDDFKKHFTFGVMKKYFYISCLLLSLGVYMSVSCEAKNAPVAAVGIEKAVMSTPVEAIAPFDGANVYVLHYYPLDMVIASALVVPTRVHGVDEEFFRNGYKAKLNKTVREIFVPPSYHTTHRDLPIEVG